MKKPRIQHLKLKIERLLVNCSAHKIGFDKTVFYIIFFKATNERLENENRELKAGALIISINETFSILAFEIKLWKFVSFSN